MKDASLFVRLSDSLDVASVGEPFVRVNTIYLPSEPKLMRGYLERKGATKPLSSIVPKK